VGADLPLIARRAELAILTGAIEAARCGRGKAVLLTGEAGVGKTRLLVEAQREAERPGLLVLKGRAVESGGAYRPLVDAFARASLRFTHEPELAGVRPTLARVLPGWTTDHNVLALMADPAAVLAEALILLLRAMAADGSVLLVDDLQWADEDTISVESLPFTACQVMTPVHCWSRQSGPRTALIDTPKRRLFSRGSRSSLNRLMSSLRSSGPRQHWPSEGSRQSRSANARRRSPKSAAASTSPVRPCCSSVMPQGDTTPTWGHTP
jgi:hypothetical protein